MHIREKTSYRHKYKFFHVNKVFEESLVQISDCLREGKVGHGCSINHWHSQILEWKMRVLFIPSLFLNGLCGEQITMKGMGGNFRFWGNNDNPSLTGLWVSEEQAPRYQLFLRLSSHSFLQTGYKVFLAAESLMQRFSGIPKHLQGDMKTKQPPRSRLHKGSTAEIDPKVGFHPCIPTLSCSVLLCKAVITLLQCREGLTSWAYQGTHFWAVHAFGSKMVKEQLIQR